MEELPTTAGAVEMEAIPFTRGSVPMVDVPFVKVTVPVGVPVAGAAAVTVAVNVTGWPTTDGFTDDSRATDAVSGLTTSVRVLDVAGAKLLSPE
jgi:hypothetical protein